jgi:anti-sigma28 factor (negative regulator of flagellin synthesis)
MGIDKVSSFLFARSLGSQAEFASKQGARESEASQVGKVVDEAAVISKKSGFLLELSERRERVEALKDQVRSGTYQQPTAEALAKSFLQDVGLG